MGSPDEFDKLIKSQDKTPRQILVKQVQKLIEDMDKKKTFSGMKKEEKRGRTGDSAN